MQRITWFAYYSTFFAMSIIKIHSFPPFCVKSLFLGLFIYYVIFVQSIFCIYTVLTLHFNTSNLFPYKKSTAKPFPEPGGMGGGGRGGGTYYEGLYVGFRPTGGPFSGFI